MRGPDRLLHGLRVRSEVPLEGRALPPEPRADLDFVIVDHLPAPPRRADPLLHFDHDDGQKVRAVTADDGSTLISFSDQYRFRIAADHRTIELAVEPGESLAMATILAQGWVLAMNLMLRGELVLHATAVVSDGRAVCLLADSGMGKSTLAALLARDGASLLSDDLARIDRDRGTWSVHAGSSALRLRPAAGELARYLDDQIPGTVVERSADNRTVVRLPDSEMTVAPVAAILVPHPIRDLEHVEVHWMDPALAVVELNAYPRVYDWVDTGPPRRQFEMSAGLAEDVPVGLMKVPWGPPWREGLLRQILDVIRRRDQERAGFGGNGEDCP